MMPELGFDCLEVKPDPYAAAPTLRFRLRITEHTGDPVHAIALRIQIRIEPQRRTYGPAEQERLRDLFGEPERWADTLKPFQFASVSHMVGGFTGSTECEVPVPVTYDLEVATGKYFRGLQSGEVPLVLLFSGTLFTRGEGGFSVSQIPWHHEASYRLPIELWRETIELAFPGTGWLRLAHETIDRLARFKTDRALPTWDAAVERLLEEAGG